jgi:hypothetical protein
MGHLRKPTRNMSPSRRGVRWPARPLLLASAWSMKIPVCASVVSCQREKQGGQSLHRNRTLVGSSKAQPQSHSPSGSRPVPGAHGRGPRQHTAQGNVERIRIQGHLRIHLVAAVNWYRVNIQYCEIAYCVRSSKEHWSVELQIGCGCA